MESLSMHNIWTPIIEIEAIPLNTYQIITIDLISVIIGNDNGQYFALENRCTHDGGELAGGELEKGEILCPRHGAGFCTKTGKVTRPPADESIQAFPLRIKDGKIEIQC